MTKVKSCSCVHRFQDERYGKNQRVHNKAKGKDGIPVWRCTVCKLVKS